MCQKRYTILENMEEIVSYKQEIDRITFDAPKILGEALRNISDREMIPVAAIIRANLMRSLAAEIEKLRESANAKRD